jgi:hypothetical protein
VIQFLYPISVRKREQEVANLILASTLIFFGGLLLGAVSQKEPAVSAR